MPPACGTGACARAGPWHRPSCRRPAAAGQVPGPLLTRRCVSLPAAVQGPPLGRGALYTCVRHEALFLVLWKNAVRLRNRYCVFCKPLWTYVK